MVLPPFERAKIVIIGAGPTGLGAAHRLHELGHSNFVLFEKESQAGGLASSFRDAEGFTWDIGGHVQFSHYAYFDDLMERLLAGEWLQHERQAWVWMRERFIPYPFQNNIRHLPPAELRDCLRGLIACVRNADHGAPPANFEEWIYRSFGDGIARCFMIPYNRKVWAYPPSELAFQWIGERVAQIDLERIVMNIVEARDDVGWGPNNRFRFPLRGGTGEIWRRLAATLPRQSIVFGKTLVGVFAGKRQIVFSDGSREDYDILISTMPLDQLVHASDLDDLKPAAWNLRRSATHVIGVGMKGAPGPQLYGKCWMYFPESNAPFYRVTVFSNYSPNNVPDAGRFWSLMAEVSEPAGTRRLPAEPVRRDAVVEQTVRAMQSCGLIPSVRDVVSRWHYRAGHGYPTPSLGRDAALQILLPALERKAIFSRGRFGAWKYEVSNQDHSLMQGVELVDRLANHSEEMTLNQPGLVNGGKRVSPNGARAAAARPAAATASAMTRG
ncbi:MAG TPA: FAD-dependent oxidoreductase [Bryobacteraceae bacterium]|nr:FAD-dependent oxidoreductase [Bryobacteraceae bacterium]